LVRAFCCFTVVAGILLGARTFPATAAERVYYIAADEVTWDYLPAKRDLISGRPFPKLPADVPFSRFIKAVYREYTDDTFLQLRLRPADQQYLGTVGPIIRAEVGDTIKVVFRNHARHPYSMHPHGVVYEKAHEGAPYLTTRAHGERTSGAVPPGGTRTYLWRVPERAGPGPGDGSSVLWMYHSHVNESRDVSSGLIGPLIVTRKGSSRSDATPSDVDREFIVLFAFGSETDGWYIKDSVKRFVPHPEKTNVKRKGFFDDNVRPNMNGYSFGNMPMPTMRVGDRVRWYVMASAGNDGDFHTPHWHGQTLLSMGMRTDTLQLLPAGMMVADMIPDNPGVWLFHCHVPGHLDGGMVSHFRVLPKSTGDPP
jgi:FtsP/CotA-like multicopper oxidase with cupredoxin domain